MLYIVAKVFYICFRINLRVPMTNIESIAIERFQSQSPINLDVCQVKRQLVGSRIAIVIDCPSTEKCHELWRDRYLLMRRCLDLWLANQIVISYKGHPYGNAPIRHPLA